MGSDLALRGVILGLDGGTPALGLTGALNVLVQYIYRGIRNRGGFDDLLVDKVETTSPLMETVWSYLLVSSLNLSIRLVS